MEPTHGRRVPVRGRLVAVQLSAGSDEAHPRLLELPGDCPSDPDAHIIHTTLCESAEDTRTRAAVLLRRG